MSQNKLKPLGNRVVVKRVKAPTSKGGILLPETAKEKPREGEVLAVGPGKLNDNGQREPLNVQVGDRVYFSNYAGTEVVTDEEEYLILPEDDILGIVVR